MKILDDDLYFAKLKPNAIIPNKKQEDAGYDLYACFEEDYFVIEAGCSRPVPTGIASAFSSKYYAQIEERSSMAKIGIKKSGGVIDSGYRGEYLVVLYNTRKLPFIISKIDEENLPERIEVDGKVYNKNEVIIYPYKKAICQIVMQIIPELKVTEVTYEDLTSIESERGAGGFGHSGK